MQWKLLYNVPFERYMVNFRGGSFFLCSVYNKSLKSKILADSDFVSASCAQ